MRKKGENMLDRYRSVFTDSRWDEIVADVKSCGMDIDFTHFYPNEIEFILNETRMTDNERKGGILLFCKALTKKQICDRLGVSRATLWRHEKKVRAEIRRTCCRMFK